MCQALVLDIPSSFRVSMRCGVKNDKVNAEWPDDNTLLWNGNKLSLYAGPLPCPDEEPD